MILPPDGLYLRAIPHPATKLNTSRFASEINKESSSKSLKNASVARTINTAIQDLVGIPVIGLDSAKRSGSKPSLPNDWTILTVPIKLVKIEAVIPKIAQI